MATTKEQRRTSRQQPSFGAIFLKVRVNQQTRELCRQLATWRNKSISEWLRDHVAAEYALYLKNGKRAA